MTANLVTGFSPVKELKANVAANVSPASGTDFSDVLKNSTGKENAVADPKDQVKNPGEKDRDNKLETDDGKEVKSDRPEETKDTDMPVKERKDTNDKKVDEKAPLTEEAVEKVTEAAAAIVQTVAQLLDIPAEEVTQAMEDIGITDLDILNPATVPNLVVEIKDVADVTEIMTNEDMFADVKQIMGEVETTLNELAETLQIPVEELKSQISDEAAKVKLTDTDEVKNIIPSQIVEESDDLVKMPVKTDEKKTDRDLSVSKEVLTQSDVSEEQDLTPVSARHEDTKRQDTGNERRQPDGQTGFAQTVTDTIKDMVAAKIEQPVATYADTASQIMDQVRESLRMTMTEDITQMEMNLHPASLGNVRVQVAAKDGVITASFTTQNEQVKEVLEAQVIQLKEQMNEQGIKIEAVEVTVSAHAFERNLSEGGEDRGGQADTEAKRKRVRGINLNGGDLEDLEDLDEEDRVTADMMARQGNTVDYMA